VLSRLSDLITHRGRLEALNRPLIKDAVVADIYDSLNVVLQSPGTRSFIGEIDCLVLKLGLADRCKYR
jgi:hypothetical protein